MAGAANDAYEDAVAALERLRDNADRYGIDPEAIVPAGYSAGAINALHALHRPADTPAAGVVAVAGMMFAGVSPGRGASIVFSGMNDTIVPHATARDQCARSSEVGHICRCIAFEGADHSIGVTQAAATMEQTAHLVFENVLLPLGYRAGRVDAAA